MIQFSTDAKQVSISRVYPRISPHFPMHFSTDIKYIARLSLCKKQYYWLN